MKHLLILLISILLLSTPVIGDNHKGETLYQWYANKKDKDGKSLDVWKTFGDEKVLPKYEGEVENGLPNGIGVLTFGSCIFGCVYKRHKYVGEWKNGEWEGEGTLIRANGEKKVGIWKKTSFYKGKVYDKNGKIKYKIVNGKEIKP